MPKTADVLSHLPPDLTFDVDPDEKLGDDALRAALVAAVSSVDALFVPECVQKCDMAKFCRSEAWATDDPARLGRDARDNLAGVHSLADALRLAEHGPNKDESDLADVAEALGDAFGALQRARALVPTAGVTPPAPLGGTP